MTLKRKPRFSITLSILVSLNILACSGSNDGARGDAGLNGKTGLNGKDGTNGSDGTDGKDGTDGTDGTTPVAAEETLGDHFSKLAKAISLDPAHAPIDGFPLENISTDQVRVVGGLQSQIVAAWLDPLSYDQSPNADYWGDNNDFIAYFGDGWQDKGTPYFSGSSQSGHIWTNHEYISGSGGAKLNSPPQGSHIYLAHWLQNKGVLPSGDITSPSYWTNATVDIYTNAHKRQLGGTWAKVARESSTGRVSLDRSQPGIRYDATSNTLIRVTGVALDNIETDDQGNPLDAGVVSGMLGNCSGGVTPWGTVFSAEENVQYYYGELEDCYDSRNVYLGNSCAEGNDIAWPTNPVSNADFSPTSTANHSRDAYGYIVEIDLGADPGLAYDSASGDGHQKLGALGRAHWENAAFALGKDWKLIDGQPIVLYAGDDQRGGRIYKFVSALPYSKSMTKKQTRDLLNDGKIYAAHFADLDNDTGLTVGGTAPTVAKPGHGQWIELSLSNQAQLAPNGTALSAPTKTVGQALADNSWNHFGAFTKQDDVKKGLFSAANKLGIKELNRPEDIEFNPIDRQIYVAFTKHGRPNVLFEDGRLDTGSRSEKEGKAARAGADDPYNGQTKANQRPDPAGAIFSILEMDTDAPATSMEFTYHAAWLGTIGTGIFDVANPDNIMIDAQGHVWFGTDGNFDANGTADAIYYLDTAAMLAYRIAAAPSNAEATGPALSSDQKTLFFNVQHPGEDGIFSNWPDMSIGGPRSGMVAISIK